MNPKLHYLLIFLGGTVLTMALFFGNGPHSSWAAPKQNPLMQTVPTRPPEETPSPATPPVSSPDSAPRTDPADDDNDERDGDILLPTRTPEEAESGQTEPVKPDDNNENSPAKPSQPESGTQHQDKPPGPVSGQEIKADEAPVTPQQADLSLLKWVNNSTPKLGEIITITTVLSNSGPSRTTNVIIRDLLPPELVFISTLAGRGSYEAEQGLWTINTIGRSEQVTMSLVVRVADTKPIRLTAEVVAVDQFDPDSTPNNNLPLEDDQYIASITPSVEASLAGQSRSDLIDLGTTGVDQEEPVAFSGNINQPYWLLALVMGIGSIMIGVRLVHRS